MEFESVSIGNELIESEIRKVKPLISFCRDFIASNLHIYHITDLPSCLRKTPRF